MIQYITLLWFRSQVGKAIDCNSMIAGPSPAGTSRQSTIWCGIIDGDALVAQLDRVPHYECGGHEFESYLARQTFRDVA